jgi:hypothetical protein
MTTIIETSPLRAFRGPLILIGTALLVLISFFGWKDLYRLHLEHIPPSFEIVQKPRGIGLSPVTFLIRVADPESGLRDLDVSLRQNANSQTLLPQIQLHGVHKKDVRIDVPGQGISLLPGKAEIVINATDQSIWHTAGSLVLDTTIDFTHPTLSVVDAPTSILEGEMALIFYRVADEDISVSGITINNETLLGFPARFIDPDFKNENLYVVPFVAPLGKSGAGEIKLFAEDKTGNATTLPLPLSIRPIEPATKEVALTPTSLRALISRISGQNLSLLENYFRDIKEPVPLMNGGGDDGHLIQLFSLFNSPLRKINNAMLSEHTATFRAERYWKDQFLLPDSTALIPYGSHVDYRYKGQSIGTTTADFTTRTLKRDSRTVNAPSSGVVLFIENFGTYGRTLAIDHGLGIVTLFLGLDDVSVRPGEKVEDAQEIGTAFSGEDGNSPQFGFGVRVSGIAVNPAQWLDRDAFAAAISGRINFLKRKLGISVEMG